ncbi:MAG: hypothetical protein WCP58_09755 [bacterium]
MEKGIDVATSSIDAAETFTVTVTNNGPSATEVTVLDVLPSGLTSVNTKTTTGAYEEDI